MPEETVWRGGPSQWKNSGVFVLQAAVAIVVFLIFIAVRRGASGDVRNLSPYILLLLLVPIFIVLAHYLKTKNKIYELTTERLKTSEGIFSKVTETLELYRVKDLETHQPFRYRLVGIENVQLNTSDTSSPFILIQAVPHAVGVGDKIRNQVEMVRQQKGVREIDVE